MSERRGDEHHNKRKRAERRGLSTPELLRERFERLLPPEALPFALGERTPTHAALRLHALNAPHEQTLAQLSALGFELSPLEGRLGVYTLPWAQRSEFTHSPISNEGSFYMMNPSSTLAVEALNPQPGEEVLDLAAAPGGKSLMIADLMRDEGRLACVEPVRGRFFRLKDNLARGRVSIAQLYNADGCAVGRKVPSRFDRVMLDAPCSSEARVKLNEPETWAHWSPRKVKETSRKQRKLLRSALESVRVGGRVVYSTCALSPEENEGTVSDVLKRFEGEVEVLSASLPHAPTLPGLTSWEGEAFDPRCERAVRVAPNGVYDAFFLCVLERRA